MGASAARMLDRREFTINTNEAKVEQTRLRALGTRVGFLTEVRMSSYGGAVLLHNHSS